MTATSLYIFDGRFKALLMAVAAIVAMVTGAGCTDELDVPVKSECQEGLPAEITLSISLPEAPVISRGDMQAGLDQKVNTLWVAVYNANTGARTGVMEFTDLNESLNHNYRSISLEALSGRSYIVAVANYNYRYASVDDSGKLIAMSEALEQADTWNEFTSISAAFNTSGTINTEAPLNALVMSGFYTEDSHTDGSLPQISAVDIYPGNGALKGAIHLRRLISQVKFNITINSKNINSCAVESWQVMNMPAHSWLHERTAEQQPENAPDARTAADNRFLNSTRSTEITRNANSFTFDFWQLENKRSGLEPGPAYNNTNAYSYRELEYKNPDGSNSDRYVSLIDNINSSDYNNFATYVRFHVTLDMKVDENGDDISDSGLASRTVETDYVVHLGYVEGYDNLTKARDFNCRRNARYIYNVTINNVNDLVVEARNENGQNSETNPAVEGFVSDITDSFFEVDAHYAQTNIYLTASEIANFEYLFSVPALDGSNRYINSMNPASVPATGSSDYKYISWIELRPTTGQNVFATYKPRTGANADGRTYTLDQVKGKLSAGWYTMFINENTYEEGAYAYGNETGSKAWHDYVNRPERRVWLNVAAYTSADGNSIHYTSKYALSQKSIQTYYVSSSASGLGVEHVNESMGLNLRNNYNPGGNGNTASGRFNAAYYLAGNTKWSENASLTWRDDRYNWSSFLTLTSPQNVNAVNNQNNVRAARTEALPAIITISGTASSYDPDQTRSPKFIEAITACLNRNRDLDGDGKIDANELRWFVPTRAQYVRVILGRRSLETPIVNVENLTKLQYTRNDYNSSLMLYTSDGRQIWAMEGTSDSKWMEWGGGAPWHVRCVRNLGGNMTVINESNVTEPAFELRKGTNIIDLSHYDANSIRTEPYYSVNAPMPPHHIFDQRYNRCYKAFEFADAEYDLLYYDLDGFIPGTTEWGEYLLSHNPCASLKEKTGKDGWRVPNQKELTIMGILGKSPRSTAATYARSCTFSYFDRESYTPGNNPKDPDGTISEAYRWIMKVTSNSDDVKATQGDDGGYFVLRCVRDYVE